MGLRAKKNIKTPPVPEKNPRRTKNELANLWSRQRITGSWTRNQMGNVSLSKIRGDSIKTWQQGKTLPALAVAMLLLFALPGAATAQNNFNGFGWTQVGNTIAITSYT